jgi:hypothetical protein
VIFLNKADAVDDKETIELVEMEMREVCASPFPSTHAQHGATQPHTCIDMHMHTHGQCVWRGGPPPSRIGVLTCGPHTAAEGVRL